VPDVQGEEPTQVPTSESIPEFLPRELVQSLLQESRVLLYLRIAANGTILAGSPAAARMAGVPENELEGVPVSRILTQEDGAQVEGWVGEGAPPPATPQLLNFATAQHEVHTYQCRILLLQDELFLVGEPELEDNRTLTEELLRLNNELSVLSRENIRRNRELQAQREQLSETLADLRASHWHLEKIQQYLPLCMNCGRMKTGETHWESISDYLRSNEILVSHGLCPPCADEMMEEG
jgi:hypothetical protein